MQNIASVIVILGTGGTIAGTAATAGDDLGYDSAQLGVSELLATLPTPAGSSEDLSFACEQVAQIDSKDMDFDVWLVLAQRVAHHLDRAQVTGIVITHGTDTIEETAYFLHRVLAPQKPVVLTGAMRPASGVSADGPRNLLDALMLAARPDTRGVTVVLAGTVHSALDVRKVHTFRTDAFSSGDAGALAHIESGTLRQHRPWPEGPALGLDRLPFDVARWPRIELLTSHAGARGAVVDAVVAAGADGIVVAGTGNGSLHCNLEAALLKAQAAGVAVVRSSRCLDGAVLGVAPNGLASAAALTPTKARIDLLLRLMPAP